MCPAKRNSRVACMLERSVVGALLRDKLQQQRVIKYIPQQACEVTLPLFVCEEFNVLRNGRTILGCCSSSVPFCVYCVRICIASAGVFFFFFFFPVFFYKLPNQYRQNILCNCRMFLLDSDADQYNDGHFIIFVLERVKWWKPPFF